MGARSSSIGRASTLTAQRRSSPASGPHFRAASPSDTVNVIDGDVDLIEFLGNDALINFKYAGVEIGVLLPAGQCPAVGDHVRMTFSNDNLHVFDKETGRSLARR